MFPQQLCRATQQAFYWVAEAYGFQQLNPAGEHGVWVTATAGLAADQVIALLRDAAGRRAHAQQQGAAGTIIGDWEAAICDVHAEYFEEYNRWRRKLCLPHPELQQQRLQDPKQQQQWRLQQRDLPEQHKVAQRLLELALQFCIYTEAANLRHTPHVLFLVYYVFRGSTKFSQILSRCVSQQPGQQAGHNHWLYWASLQADDFPSAAIASANTHTASDGSSSASADEKDADARIVPGACDINMLMRSLVQQLSDAVPGVLQATVCASAAGRGGTAAPAPSGASAAAADGSSGASSASSVRAAADGGGGGASDDPTSQGRSNAQQDALTAAARSILSRVQQQNSRHTGFVQELLTAIMDPTWHQHQQTYLHLAVQPLFYFLAEQIDLAGQQAEEEPALRIAYCDVNESCCSPAAVYGLIAALKQHYGSKQSSERLSSSSGQSSNRQSSHGQRRSESASSPACGDLWEALQQVMKPSIVQPDPKPPARKWKRLFGGEKEELPENVKHRYPRDQKRLDLLNRLDLLQSGTSSSSSNGSSNGLQRGASQQFITPTFIRGASLDQEATPLNEVYSVAKRGADFWAAHLFRHKTYVEARSAANPFIAFWRVYAFHAALLTAMGALAYVWHERDRSAAIPWVRLVAALLLPTVSDALMRAARAAAHLVLLSYRMPVNRKVGKKLKALDPFPRGGYSIAVSKVVLLLTWLAWTGALALAVIPVLIAAPLSFSQPINMWVQQRLLWLAPAVAHVVFIWGHAVLCQRPGYTTSLFQELSTRFARTPEHPEGLKAATALARRSGARAYCAADPAIDALFYPASNLVIDRRRWLRNAALWLVVLAVKVAFELVLVIYPLVSLMSVIARRDTSFLSGAVDIESNPQVVVKVGNAMLCTALAVPVILLSLSDTGLLFSLVGAALSAFEGFQKGVGSVKTWAQMVSRSETLLRSYQLHCVSRSATLLHLHSKDALSVQEVSISALAAGWNALVLDLRERDLLNNSELASLTFEQLQLTHSQKQHLRELPHVGRLGLTSVLPARCFMAGAVPDLASGSVGSPHHLWVGRVAFGWLLWISWQTGLLYDSNDIQAPNRTAEERTAIAEAREREAIANLQHLTNLKFLHPPRAREQIQRWEELLVEVVALLRLLSTSSSMPSNTFEAAAAVVASHGLASAAAAATAQAKRPEGLLHGVPPDEKKRREVWRALSGHVHRMLQLLDKELRGVEKLVQGQGPRRSRASSSGGFMATLWGHREADITPAEYRRAREALSGLRNRWEQLASAATREDAPGQRQRVALTKQDQETQELLQVQVLEHIARVGRASEGPAQVCRWLTDVLTMFAGDTVPADEEATRFIISFASSLSDPGLGVAPSVQCMPSLTTLVPHYDEDVLYALSEGDAVNDMRITDPSKLTPDGRAKMVYLLRQEGGSTPTLSYLRSVYNTPGQPRTQWGNFVERVLGLAAAQGIKRLPTVVEEYHFLPGGVLHPLKQELLLWASWRGQLLSRTVRGLMSYRTALQALIAHENPHLMPPEDQQKLDSLEESRHMWAKKYEQLQQYEQRVKKLQEDAGRPSIAGQQQQQGEGGRQSTAGQETVRVAAEQLAAVKQKLKAVEQKLKAVTEACKPLQQQHQQYEALRRVLLDDLVDSKYHLVVSSQNFGVFASKESASNMKAGWLVHSLHTLRQRHPTLKVAYIDKQKLATASVPGSKVELFRHASVLLASTHQQQLWSAAGLPQHQEAYRVLLPINFESARGVVIGEGKPENQNHAVVFCPGEALQTIDCNQDNIVAEGLKLRNLLAELLPEGWDTAHLSTKPTLSQIVRQGTQRLLGVQGGGRGQAAAAAAAATAGQDDSTRLLRQVPQGKGRVALVGFREWIFSEDSGALAEFAAATERSFGTTVQRLMHNPGACRFHYGHPDVWRRSFVSTCGGVSKANKSLHVSEDVFGGYNVMLRGRDVKYVDYIAVGKGRDMGFETINTFEAKIAAGNGEQVLSRDVRRLAHNIDFTRLMSWYHTGNGFFINTAITMISVQASLWAYLLLALDKSVDPEVQKYLSAIQVLQLGTLSVVVYLFTLTLEMGLLSSLFTIIRQVLQGSLMFYIFRAQTSAHMFTYDLLFGGAKYLPTGRGYKLAATSFKDLYRRFGRSHFYFGAVLLQYVVACVAAGHLKGAGLLVLWAQGLVVVSLLFGPFWFTPFAFRTTLVTEEFDRLQQWFVSPSPNPEHSWRAWNADSWKAAADAGGRQMGRLAACIRAHMFKLPTFVLVLASVARMKSKDSSELPKWALALILAGSVVIIVGMILSSRYVAARTALKSQIPRTLNVLAIVLLAGGIAVSGWATSGQPVGAVDELNTYSNVFLVFFGTILLLRLLPLVYYSVLGRSETFKDVTNGTYYLADVLLMYFLNGLRFVLSLFDILTGLQAQLLFNTSYARQVMADAELENSKLPGLISEALVLKRKQRMLANN